MTPVITAWANAAVGRIANNADTNKIFTAPSEKLTEDYVTGRFG